MNNPIYNNRSKRKEFSWSKDHKRFYNSEVWKGVRLIHLTINPLCYRCSVVGKVVSATSVDHCLTFVDKYDPLALDPLNHYSLCQRCHGIVTHIEKYTAEKYLMLYNTGTSIKQISSMKYSNNDNLLDEDGYQLAPL